MVRLSSLLDEDDKPLVLVTAEKYLFFLINHVGLREIFMRRRGLRVHITQACTM